MSYSFSHVNEAGDIVEVFVNNDDVTWHELLAKFQDFLGGCGFIINRMEVDFAELATMRHEEVLDQMQFNFDVEFELEGGVQHKKVVEKKVCCAKKACEA